MSGDEIKYIDVCQKVQKLCEEAGIPYLFITEGKSMWNCKVGTHIHDVACFHKATENEDIYDVPEEGYL